MSVINKIRKCRETGVNTEEAKNDVKESLDEILRDFVFAECSIYEQPYGCSRLISTCLALVNSQFVARMKCFNSSEEN